MKWKQSRAYLVIFIVAYLWSCVPVDDERFYSEAVIDLSDAQTVRILDYQDRHVLDSLLFFLAHENPSYRLAATRAFASYQDTAALDDLIRLLDDPFEEVRAMAAYAIGQIGHAGAEPALIKAFNQFDSTQQHLESNSRILEAVGKVGSASSLVALATVKTYGAGDTLLVLGQTRGIYQFGLRGMVAPEGTATMISYVTDRAYPEKVRVMASNYLMRMRDIQLDTFVRELIPLFANDRNPDIRMAIAAAFGKVPVPSTQKILLERLPLENDPRVQCNILRALRNFPYAGVKHEIYPLLKSRHPEVAMLAAAYFLEKGIRTDALDYRAESKQNYPWPVKATLYAASNRHLPNYYTITKTNINNEIERYLELARTKEERIAYLSALGEDIRNYEAIWNTGFDPDEAVIMSATVQVMADICKHPSFRNVLGGPSGGPARTLRGYLMEAIESGDAGAAAIAAEALRSPDSKVGRPGNDEIQAMESALASLELPREIETYNALLETISFLKGVAFKKKETAFNHPIDWSLIRSRPDTIGAELITSRGLILAELYPNAAPGTVANFIQLVQDQYYDGKSFHRVVPNFVIQGGCPRGDGFGSLDYTIRSEFAPLYYEEEGYIGMASAGKDTECTQFFITHSPTPHLSGRYTIFGKVKKGMDVVKQVQAGDLIKEVHILN